MGRRMTQEVGSESELRPHAAVGTQGLQHTSVKTLTAKCARILKSISLLGLDQKPVLTGPVPQLHLLNRHKVLQPLRHLPELLELCPEFFI